MQMTILKRQSTFTTTLVSTLRSRYPRFNALVFIANDANQLLITSDVNNDQQFYASGWNLPGNTVFTDKVYNVTLFIAGDFWLNTDGGFVNWAYGGCYFTRDDNPDGGSHVRFELCF